MSANATNATAAATWADDRRAAVRAASRALLELFWLLLLVPLAAGFLVQRRVRSVFERYRASPIAPA